MGTTPFYLPATCTSLENMILQSGMLIILKPGKAIELIAVKEVKEPSL
ncbi:MULTISPECIES: hypothetical protein [Paenibacillus]|uniref:Uncharacterized protein n=1 Tax=Paenibacillus lactis TaxID=228574 RepID=A0ABS4F6V2_9BACL|nr:hypothetical protein [Paenibacillus lactis]MBP1891990.1 hypothetical protein [Paenibacillus lactis]GIO89232.1 hypothetical protein J31TS3_04590 [Paenibacillus lactis]